MSKTIVKKLNREEFNKAVVEAEKMINKLGIKKVEACVFYSYIDKNNNIVKLICNEFK